MENPEAAEVIDVDPAGHGPLEVEVEASAPSVAVLSDAHLGDRDSWLERQVVQDAVVEQLREDPSIGTLVLLGDVLDLNFGNLITSVEGRWRGKGRGRRPGFRVLVEAVCRDTNIGTIVYVVGNHDYMIWDWEATRRRSLVPLAGGDKLSPDPLWWALLDDSFLAGVVPHTAQVQFLMAFPHCVAAMGGHRVVLSHGHWFAKVQTGGVALSDADTLDAPKRKKFLRDLVIASAQYQNAARAVAIRRRTRAEVEMLYKLATGVWDCVTGWYRRRLHLRGRRPSRDLLRTINTYLRCVAKESSASAFVFGHTHVPGEWVTPEDPRAQRRAVPVYNSGSFVPPDGENASMLILKATTDGVAGELVYFTEDGEKAAPPRR